MLLFFNLLINLFDFYGVVLFDPAFYIFLLCSSYGKGIFRNLFGNGCSRGGIGKIFKLYRRNKVCVAANKCVIAYFGAVFVLGTIFNGIATKTGNNFWSANYLFMFDQETASGFIPFLGELFNINFSIGSLTFYPLMLLVVYVVFNIICFIVFFAIQLIYLIKDKI